MTGKELGSALREGRRVYGTSIVSNSAMWPSAVRGTGVDFVFLDTEHVAQDRVGLSWMCRTYAALGLPPVVRIPSPDPYTACTTLDGGASGIIAPYVETADEARALVGATKLRPLKGARLKAALEDVSTLEAGLKKYVDERNANNVLILNIESVPAIQNLDAIVAVPGVDAVLIGPHDLSCSLGIPEQYNAPEFDEAVRTIFSTARAAGVGAGLHFFWDDMDQEIEWIKAGGNLVMHSGDISVFGKAMGEDIAALRKGAGDAAAQVEGEDVII
jgi:staphyloferrin B biosynthesis citrate synthase